MNDHTLIMLLIIATGLVPLLAAIAWAFMIARRLTGR